MIIQSATLTICNCNLDKRNQNDAWTNRQRQTWIERRRGGAGGGEMVRNLPTIGEGIGKKAEMEATEIDSNLIGR